MADPINSENHIPSTVVIPGVTPGAQPAQSVAPVQPVVPVQPVTPVQPQQQPQAQPQQPPAVEPKGDIAEPLNTGNAALDSAVAVFTTLTKATDTDLQRAAGNALEYSNEALIDMAFIKERFGAHADQAVTLIKAAIAEKGAIVARQTNEVHQLAGGKANWDAALSVYQTNAPEHIKAAVVALVDSGKTKEGVRMLLDFAANQGLNPGTVALDNPSNTNGAAGALSATEFRTELNKLYAEAGGRSVESGVYGERYHNLMARRQAGRQLGR